jgi:hypothetical protein
MLNCLLSYFLFSSAAMDEDWTLLIDDNAADDFMV